MIRAATPFAAGICLLMALVILAGPARAGIPGFGDTPLIEGIKDDSVKDVKAALLDGAPPNQRALDGTPGSGARCRHPQPRDRDHARRSGRPDRYLEQRRHDAADAGGRQRRRRDRDLPSRQEGGRQQGGCAARERIDQGRRARSAPTSSKFCLNVAPILNDTDPSGASVLEIAHQRPSRGHRPAQEKGAT